MLVYLCLLLCVFLLFLILKDKKKALIISFVFITIVATLRKYTVGVDTTQFYRMFTLIVSDSTWNYSNFRYEAGFYYLCKILGLITSDPQILIVITSIFINSSVYKFIKKNSKDFFLSTILYIVMNFFFSNMNIMRQAFALAILLYGFEFLKEKKYIKYIIIVFVASLFHTVSFAALLLLGFSILPPKKVVYFLETAGSVVAFLFYKQFFNLLTLGFGYSGYATSEFGASNYGGSLLAALEILLIMLLLFLVSYKKNNNEHSNDNTFRLLVIATILYIGFSFLVMRMNIFNRLSGLYGIYTIILIPHLLEYTKKYNKNNYKIAKVFCLLVYFFSFFVIAIYRPEWYGVIPYEFFWQ